MKTPRSKATLSLCLFLFFQSFGYSKKEKFISLFNGKDLNQWILPKGEHTWKIVDGIIDYESKGGNLTTKKSFSDYVLKLEKETEGLEKKRNALKAKVGPGRGDTSSGESACQRGRARRRM